MPHAGAANDYTWCKAPRLTGEVVEVGALARQLVSGQQLVLGLIADSGGNVRNRVIAHLFESVPRTLEQALAGAPLRPDENELVAVQHIVRSFDPSMVCTVHSISSGINTANNQNLRSVVAPENPHRQRSLLIF
jgi:Ni,Fe-hydrogenase I large subunit